MSRPVILQVGPYPEWDQQPLDTAFDVRRLFEAPEPAPFLAAHGPEVQAIATRGELGADAAMIEACPKLQLISVYGVGYDAVDLEACRTRGIRVTNTPDVLTGDVADLGVAMMLCLSRGMVEAEAWVRDGSWAAQGLYPLKRRVFGRRAGILGLGRIGVEVGRRLRGFGMDIAYSDLAPKDTDWTYIQDPTDLAAHAEFFFVTLAASAATRHIVGREVIEALGPDAMLINISRASNIDEDAL
ncbi:MAG: NAD(P)-dependent oxidoreductase, partial [Pseudomonadota bacterium]